MKISFKGLCLIFIVTIFFLSVTIFADNGVFTATGVQYRIDFNDYQSSEAFFGKIDRIVDEICSSNDVDLIVFPEYIGVFYQLIRYNEIIGLHDSFQTALVEDLAANPQFKTMADVFIADADDVDSYLESWSNIAENYEVAVIAGSCFAASEHGRLRNRSFVFDSEGSQIYYQDKVFLTEFESGIIGLEAGYIEDASFFKIAGKNIVMTICRDSYAREWEHKNSGAFLWVDIKANGEVFNTAQRQSFLRALPSRLFYSDVNYGMTVCAVGKYLDLFWEGESSALQKRDDGLYLVAAAASFDQDDTVVFKISRGQ